MSSTSTQIEVLITITASLIGFLLITGAKGHNIIPGNNHLESPINFRELAVIGNKTYMVSDGGANAYLASNLCKRQDSKLLSIQTNLELNEILKVLKAHEIADSIWTSGIVTLTDEIKQYKWLGPNHRAEPIKFLIEPMDHVLFNHRTKRQVYPKPGHGGHHGCDCDHNCPVRPNCTHVDCNIKAPVCTLHDRVCDKATNEYCTILHQPNCTATCPPCTITRGTCQVHRPPCKVTPGECTTRRDGCEVVVDPCYIVDGECTLIEESCEVIPPENPCKPYNCTCNQPNPNKPCGKKFADLRKCDDPANCPGAPCHGFGCPNPTNPCHGNDCDCYPVFYCAKDIICKPPPIVCKPPIYHCLPSKVVCPPVRFECKETITECAPPTITCEDPIKICTEDRIVCPAPQTICTPAVSNCVDPNIECSPASLDCTEPSVICPELPVCPDIPIPCWDKPKPCDCDYPRAKRTKRSLTGTELTGVIMEVEDEPVDVKCLGLKKGESGKPEWAIEKCETEKLFVCVRD